MAQYDLKILKTDTDGLLSYEFLANNIADLTADDLAAVIDNIITINTFGQFTASAARYLHAIDPVLYAPHVSRLVQATIDTDREHKYLASLASALYGPDYRDRADELSAVDNNFRRLYKRLFAQGSM